MRTDEVILSKSLRQHIGGRWAISLIAVVINFPINVVSIVANVPDSRSVYESQGLLQWLAIGVVGYLAFCLVLLLANYTVFRSRDYNPVPVWWVVVLGALSGAARGLTVSFLAVNQGLAGAEQILIRTVNGALLGAAFLPLAALLLSVIATYRTQRHVLLVERTAAEIAELRASGLTDHLRTVALADVESDVRAALVSHDPEYVRSVSRRIWNSTRTPDDHVHVGAVVRAALATNPYPTFLVSALWAISALASLWVAIGLRQSLLQIGTGVLAIAAVFAAGRWATARSPRLGVIVLAASLLLLVVITGPVSSWLFDPRPMQAGIGLMVANSVWLPSLVIGVGVAVSGIRSSERVIEQLASEVSAEEVSALAFKSEESRIRQDVAKALHGTVQSRMLAATSLGTFDQMVNEVLAGFGVKNEESSLEQELEEITKPWAALMEVSTAVTVQEPSKESSQAVVRIVEEGLSNAFRHGNATQVHLEVVSRAGEIHITLWDNGKGVDAESSSGLGSQILNTLCEWTLENSMAGGTVLRARIALT